MWFSLWNSVDRYSLQHFKYVVNELQRIKVVGQHNMEKVVDLMRTVVEIVTYGDKQDPLIFEFFMELQVLGDFVRVLKISRNSQIEAPLLQCISLMIQNISSEHAIYYSFSGEYINDIINHPFEFHSGDLASFYVSFLRAVSSKVNKDNLCLLVKVNGDTVVSFPLYTEALKFVHHEDKMIQAAVRALTLKIYTVADDMVYKYITASPISEYFSKFVNKVREQCIQLDDLVNSTRQTSYQKRKDNILLETEKFVDDLYYFKDIIIAGKPCLIRVVTENLFGLLALPILLPLLQSSSSQGSTMSTVTSLYIVSRLLQVVGGTYMVNAVSGITLHPFMPLNTTIGDMNNKIKQSDLWGNVLSYLEIAGWSKLETNGVILKGNSMLGQFSDPISSHLDVANGNRKDDACVASIGILTHVFSDNWSVSLASLFLLLFLAENKDLDFSLASAISLSRTQRSMCSDISHMAREDGGIFERFMPQILNALLKILASKALLPAQTLWHTGWLLLKLLPLRRMKFDHENLCLLNTSYTQSNERLWEELDGCWFDHILETIQKQWRSCKSALEEQSQSKDPVFVLEVSVPQKMIDGGTSNIAWQRMVEAVKVFVLHTHLMAYISNGHLLEKPLLNSASDSGKSHRLSVLSSSFGSEVSLACGISCNITFASTGIRDVYLMPVSDGTSGKLILAEKHPFRSQRGVVIAIAPLAGLSPKVDEDHPTWMHLCIREFDPKVVTGERMDGSLDTNSIPKDGRWTVGFTSKDSCEAARSLILEETNKQRSYIENILARLVHSHEKGE